MYSIKQVAAMLDIPAVTLRAWENRYGAVTPERTESGYRLYSHDNIEELRWLKEQMDKQGISISHAVRLLKAQKDSLPAETPAYPESEAQDAFEKMTGQLYDALFEFQGERANALIDFGFSAYGFEAMFYRVLAPVLVKVGDAWEQGLATVAQEHYMTQMVSNRFYQFFHLFPVHSRYPKALAFCPEGEHHQVGLLLFSLFLRKNGVEVIFLGANTPEAGIVSMLTRHPRIGVICLSVTDPALVPASEALLERLKAIRPKAHVVVGGKGYESFTDLSGHKHVISEPASCWQSWFDRTFAALPL